MKIHAPFQRNRASVKLEKAFNFSLSVPCAAGSYKSGDDMVTCKKCEGNKISSEVGGTSCKDCPNGNEANNDKTNCGTSYLLIHRK
jgi:hypothetical protein